MHQGQRDYCRAVRHVPGVAELDRVKVAAVTFWALVLALVAAVELGEFL